MSETQPSTEQKQNQTISRLHDKLQFLLVDLQGYKPCKSKEEIDKFELRYEGVSS